MTCYGAVFCRLLLISALVGSGTKFAHADEDVCQGRKFEHLAQYLGKGEVKKIEGLVESKILLSQLVQSIVELKQTAKVDKIAEALGKIADKFNMIEIGKMLIHALDNTEAAKMSRNCREIKLLQNFYGKQFFMVPSGTIFHYSNNAVNWKAARDYCQQKGMQLASLKTLEQVESVTKELTNRGFTDSWFGVSASDIGQTAVRWVDGTPVDTSVWLPGQPDQFGAGEEICVVLFTGQARLHDASLQTSVYSLCQVPAALSSCLA